MKCSLWLLLAVVLVAAGSALSSSSEYVTEDVSQTEEYEDFSEAEERLDDFVDEDAEQLPTPDALSSDPEVVYLDDSNRIVAEQLIQELDGISRQYRDDNDTVLASRTLTMQELDGLEKWLRRSPLISNNRRQQYFPPLPSLGAPAAYPTNTANVPVAPITKKRVEEMKRELTEMLFGIEYQKRRQNLPKRRQNNPLNRFRLGSGSRGRKPPAFRNQFGANEQQGSERDPVVADNSQFGRQQLVRNPQDFRQTDTLPQLLSVPAADLRSVPQRPNNGVVSGSVPTRNLLTNNVAVPIHKPFSPSSSVREVNIIIPRPTEEQFRPLLIGGGQRIPVTQQQQQQQFRQAPSQFQQPQFEQPQQPQFQQPQQPQFQQPQQPQFQQPQQPQFQQPQQPQFQQPQQPQFQQPQQPQQPQFQQPQQPQQQQPNLQRQPQQPAQQFPSPPAVQSQAGRFPAAPLRPSVQTKPAINPLNPLFNGAFDASNVPSNNLRGNSITNVECELFTEGLCLEVRNYPKDTIASFLSRNKPAFESMFAEVRSQSADDLVEGISAAEERKYSFNHYYGNRRQGDENHAHRDFAEDGGFLCPSDVRYARPQLAQNSRGVWKYLINMEDHSQTLRLERCLKPSGGCSYVSPHYKSHCVQVHNYHRLLSWDEKKGLHVDIYKIPVGCSCHIHGYAYLYPPLDGSGGGHIIPPAFNNLNDTVGNVRKLSSSSNAEVTRVRVPVNERERTPSNRDIVRQRSKTTQSSTTSFENAEIGFNDFHSFMTKQFGGRLEERKGNRRSHDGDHLEAVETRDTSPRRNYNYHPINDYIEQGRRN